MDYIKPLYSHTSLNSWQKANLDYNWYWLLTTFFGWCALDQLYLGSPIGFLAKNFVNMNTFGYWYFYDLIRATFDQQSVKFSGPGIPGLGAPGLAAGRFQRPEAPLLPESKGKHKNFFIYTLVLFIFGIAGGDSFLLGNTLSGVLRLCCLLSFIFIPVALIWWVYRIVIYLVYPTFLLEQEWNYFDYPKPNNTPPCNNMFAQFTIWVLQTIRGILNAIPGINLVTPLFDAIIDSLQIAYGMAESVVTSTVTSTGSLFLTAADTGKLFEKAALDMKTPTLEELQKLQATLPGGKSCGQAGGTIGSLAANSTSTPLGQAGGAIGTANPISSSAPALALLLSVTVGLIVVSGIVLSLRRSYQTNGTTATSTIRSGDEKEARDDKQRSERNDVPPDPGASGDPTPTTS